MGFFDWLFGAPEKPRQRRRRDPDRVVLVSRRGTRVSTARGSKAEASLRKHGWRALNPGQLTPAERDVLPPAAFAAPELRALPIHDAGHIRAAIGRFGQTPFESTAQARAAARRIVEAAARNDIAVSEKSLVAIVAGVYGVRG